MPGVKNLRRIQFGWETTNGTVVAATMRYRGPAETLDDDRTVEFVEEHVGFIGGVDRTVIPYGESNLALPETVCTPEQLQWLIANSLGGPKTGAADGAGSTGFKYVTTIPTTSRPTNNYAMSVEVGDDFETERAAYGKVTEWSIKGQQKETIKQAGQIKCQPLAYFGTSFSSTSLLDTDDLVFAGARLYLDAIGGTIGTTQVQNQFLGFELSVKQTYTFKQTGEGAAVGATPGYNLVVYVDTEITGKLTLENDTTASSNAGLRSFFRAQTPRLMRIDILGKAYTTAGSGTIFTGGRQGVRIDLPIKFNENKGLKDIEKNDIVTLGFMSHYNATAATAGTITVCNQLSAL